MSALLPPAHERPTHEWPAELPDHLSASSATMYHRCREQWRLRYVDGAKEAPSGALIWGIGDSEAAAWNYTAKILSHRDLPVTEVEEVFASTVDAKVDEFGGHSQIQWDAGQTAATVKDAGVKLAALYHRQAAPHVQPIAAEGKIEFTLPDLPVPVIGYVDVETVGEIIERKTAKAKFANGRPAGNYLAQARVYQLALGKPLHFHVSTKTKVPAVWTPSEEPGLDLPYSDPNATRTARWLVATARAIVADLETFGPDGPWVGSEALLQSPCSWCGYGPNVANICRWHS